METGKRNAIWCVQIFDWFIPEQSLAGFCWKGRRYFSILIWKTIEVSNLSESTIYKQNQRHQIQCEMTGNICCSCFEKNIRPIGIFPTKGINLKIAEIIRIHFPDEVRNRYSVWKSNLAQRTQWSSAELCVLMLLDQISKFFVAVKVEPEEESVPFGRCPFGCGPQDNEEFNRNSRDDDDEGASVASY